MRWSYRISSSSSLQCIYINLCSRSLKGNYINLCYRQINLIEELKEKDEKETCHAIRCHASLVLLTNDHDLILDLNPTCYFETVFQHL